MAINTANEVAMSMEKFTPRASASKTYVAALPMERPKIVEVEVMRELPAAPATVLMPTANYVDRARGFSLATMPLAGATSLVVLLIGITAFGVPILSVAALLLALTGFTLTWLVSYALYVFVSPDGALFLHTVFMWRILFLEAKERRARYRGK